MPRRRLLYVTMGLALLSACAPARSERTAPPTMPRSLPEPERLEGEIGGLLGEEVRDVHGDILGSVSYDLPVVANSWVEAEIDFLLSQRRDVVDSWMRRGDHYVRFVQEVFREYGIPTDLYHLGLIESGFIPVARSRAGAVGVWQFMPATSGDLGLRVNDLLDERMDPVRSTRAAARHLRTLYRVHGDWALAAAAYNAGSGRISRGLERFSATNFWDLAQRGDLAEETRRYVPRLFAMTVIGRNRERFGFSPIPETDGFAFDSIHVELTIPLTELAEIGGARVEDLTRLNPHLLNGVTPEGGYWVWVPAGTGIDLQRAYLTSQFRAHRGLGDYVVRWGDSLGRLAQLSGVASTRIRELNPTVNFDRLMVGATIKLPSPVARLLTERPSQSEGDVRAAETLTGPASTSSEPEPAEAALHEVRPGDTLWEIAREYELSIEEIQRVNELSGTVIRPGQRLKIPRSAEENDSGGPPVEAATMVEHVVQSGDTLWGIARRYGTSVDSIQRANALGERQIQPGQTLTVPL